MSSSERKIMPMRETVAGDADLRSLVSKMKLTFGPNRMRSPDGMVRRRLSSRTELSDSTHSGSMSPSHTIHDRTSGGSLTTRRAEAVRTPSNHSRVSMSICPRSCCRGMAFGFIVCTSTFWPMRASAERRMRSSADLPHPDGPTITQPIRWLRFSLSCTTFLTWESRGSSLRSTSDARIAASKSAYTASLTSVPGKISLMSASKRCVSWNVSFARVLSRTALITSSISSFSSIGFPALRSMVMSLPEMRRIVFSARRPQS
mmetsp:Transcript_19355/g.46761  ORF Transcript_19355/g.46761 Transcript_19355/m.46761 type:complete len:260 (+) Transcript_19355:6495-7274(+)